MWFLRNIDMILYCLIQEIEESSKRFTEGESSENDVSGDEDDVVAQGKDDHGDAEMQFDRVE